MTPDIIYFDNAATTFPKPPSVTEEVSKCMREYCGNAGRGSHPLALAAAETLYECREALAEMFSASAENAVFTLNTTYAINIALKSFVPLGSHILISDLEHNAVLRPVLEMQRRGELTFSTFSALGTPAQIIDGIKRKLRRNTSAVVCTLASNICSNKLPSREIGKLCRERGILFIADGAQAAGHRNVNMTEEGISVLCIPGHKGLYGPQGLGVMITAEGLSGMTVIEGGSGSDSRMPEMPEYLPDRYEAGTMNTPAAAGLLAGIRFVRDTGIGQIEAVERELWYRLYSGIGGDRRFIIYGDKKPSSVMLLNKRGRDPAEVGKALSEKGICVRSGLHCAPLAHDTIGAGEGGGIRVSFGVFNTLRQIDKLCDALYRA